MVHGGSQRQRHSHEFVPRPILILSAPQHRSWALDRHRENDAERTPAAARVHPALRAPGAAHSQGPASVAPPVRNALRAIAAQDACAASLTIRSEDRAISPPFTRLPASGPRGPGAGPDSKSLQLNGCSDHGGNQGCFPTRDRTRGPGTTGTGHLLSLCHVHRDGTGAALLCAESSHLGRALSPSTYP
jgi:hypothetical protein